MLICLEGVDGAGKTTLADQLAAQTQATDELFMLHFSQPDKHPLTEYEAGLDFYRPGSGEDVICDRYHWGEMIYSELYRNGSQLGAAGFWHVEQYLQSRGGVMVHVDAPLKVIEKRLEERGEDYLESHHVAQVRDSFAAYATRGHEAAVYAETPLSDENVRVIVQIARLREGAAKLLHSQPGYVGPLEPALLLIGERPNDHSGTIPHAAPFLPYPASSGKWLIEEVILRAPDPRQIGLVNAVQRDGSRTGLRDLWVRLHFPKVVPMGAVARQQCAREGVPCTRTAPHPAYWKRFHSFETEEYRRMILGALT